MATTAALPASPLQACIWEQVCRHIDGLAVGSTMAALHERGALALITAAPGTTIGQLRRRLGGNPGFLHVAARLLADQGWVTLSGATGTDDLLIEPTPAGHAVLTWFAPGYILAAQALPVAERMDQILFGPPDSHGRESLAGFCSLLDKDWQLPRQVLPRTARFQVRSHLDGHLVAPVMSALSRRGLLRPGHDIPLEQPDGDPEAMRLAFRVLARQQWVLINSGTARLTPAGAIAAACAPQYWHPVCYLPTFRRVPALLFGDPQQVWAQATAEREVHLDRALDIAFSGDVFNGSCRQPFLDIALPLFDQEPVSDQPTMVVDAGCGNGSLLATLYQEVRARTRRGRHLGAHPLLMVGIEPSPVARAAASARLRAAGAPQLVISGDIADPGRIRDELAAHGLDATRGLHVSKSVIHDRAYSPGRGMTPTKTSPPPSDEAFARPDGTAIRPAELARDLVGFLRGWRGLARRHGLLVIEAHAVRPTVTARLLGRTLVTELDATHGYSCQYPVDPAVFAWAAREAGFESRAHREPAAEALGHVLLTIDHFMVTDEAEQAAAPA
jgi:SAM-dependent methyltransferase